MKKKIYLIQPTYRRTDGKLQKGWNTFTNCMSIPLFSATIPSDWQKDYCLEYFDDVNFNTDSSVIGIFSMGFDILHAHEIAEKFKHLGKTVIFGGHSELFSEKIMKDVCDSVIRINPNPNLMAELLSDVEKMKLKPVYQGGLNLNFPFDYSVLEGKRIKYVPVCCCAGCKNECDYCCTAGLYKGQYRLRSMENIIKDLKAAYKINRLVGFYDSNIYNDRKFLLRLCERIKNEKLKIMWGGQSTINIGDDEEVLHALKNSGCKLLFIGLETISQKNLELLNKPYYSEKYLLQIRKIRKAGITVVGYFILGLDDDTNKSLDETIRFVNRSKISLPLFNVLVPVPGTKIFQKLKSENRLLISSEEEFIKTNPIYSVPCDCITYNPKNFTVKELHNAYFNFARKVSSWFQIIKRTFVSNPLLAIIILYVNIYFRREYLKMQKARN